MKANISDSTDSVASETGGDGPRRRWILGASAATAALLGAGTAWWRTQSAGAVATVPGSPIEGFWSLQWETPQGATVATQSFRGHPLLVNFWATWCPPCVEELPLINDFYRQNKSSGWNVLALAIDKPAPVQAFLQKMPLDFPVGMAGLSGAELGRELGNLAGSLPFSVALGANGEISQRKIGRLSSADLETWLRLK
jgi:thiol-disulfide isomerase/thioredoxin